VADESAGAAFLAFFAFLADFLAAFLVVAASDFAASLVVGSWAPRRGAEGDENSCGESGGDRADHRELL